MRVVNQPRILQLELIFLTDRILKTNSSVRSHTRVPVHRLQEQVDLVENSKNRLYLVLDVIETCQPSGDFLHNHT